VPLSRAPLSLPVRTDCLPPLDGVHAASGASVCLGCAGHPGELEGVKFMRDKMTGLPSGFGFIEFSSHEAASRILQSMNGQPAGAWWRVCTTCVDCVHRLPRRVPCG
jgi:RNA recognition motif-containing protein